MEELTSIPKRNTSGEIDLFILQCINGALTIAEIAGRTEEQFPGVFSNYERLLEHVNKLVLTYSRERTSRCKGGRRRSGK